MSIFKIGLYRNVSSIILMEFVLVITMCITGHAKESVVVRMSNIDKQEDYLFVRGELLGLETNRDSIVDTFVTTNLSRSSNNLRYGYHQQIRGGDSGSPTFLIYGNKLVLLGTHWTVGTDSSVAMAVEQIQEAMDYLAPGYHLRIENFNSTSEESESQ